METENKYSGTSVYSGMIICGNCGNFYSPKIEHSNDEYRRFVLMCRNRFKSGIYCRNTRIYEEKLPDIICKMAKAYIAEYPQALVIETITVYPGGRMIAKFINGDV